MSEYLYEVRTTKIRKAAIQLVPYSELSNYQGFRSMYGYTQETADLIMETKSTAGLDGAPVYSDLLLVDFDNNEDAAHAMADELRAYDWVKFDSGGRSIHLHIRINPMFGANVPHIQKLWMFQNFPKADLSIYKTAGIYRLANTIHEKNPGRAKKVLETNLVGNALELKLKDDIMPEPKKYTFIENSELTNILECLISIEVKEGTVGRNTHVFKIGRVCNELGLSPYDAIKLSTIWNEKMCIPSLPEASLISAIKSAYRGKNEQMGKK